MTSMRFVDTRGNLPKGVSFTKAVLDGLAPGGGLFVPESVPALSLQQICDLADLSYAQRAAQVYRAFRIDLDDALVDELCARAYGDNFDDERIVPLVKVEDGIHVIELWHGPTSAFKDMALQCLPLFFTASAQRQASDGRNAGRRFILVATSGDTGKAALAGFANVEGVDVGVLYPDGGVSDIQFKQMATQTGDNVAVWGVSGNFDDCQTGAKAVFADADFARQLENRHGVSLSSANSINWGRLMPQIVYYLSAYAQMVREGTIAPGDPVDVCVPTGNFGNILAAYYAKTMGAPLRLLMCASNENRVLCDFINTGLYDISNRPFVKTPTPSMDILVSSNLERQLFELTDRDPAAIASWMSDLRENRAFRVDRDTFTRVREHFRADSVGNDECLDVIRSVHERCGYLLDPHTAVAYRVAERLRDPDVPVIVASTAHWAKFGDNVYRALHGMRSGEDLPADIASLTGCQLNALVAREANASAVPAGLASLDDTPIRFTEVIEGATADIEQAISAYLSGKQV
ncbi:threonine synthase [Berryella wangjianweii]|uniref:threonine synthase n=1 Tax=Berryella wangjianweii TaxID=2734634 RepID=UPI0021BDCECD|nr:threonine synthase [Berryella wangjianweii]